MTNNNWNTVNWDEIPEDVDAVVTFEHYEPNYYKTVDGDLQVQSSRSGSFGMSNYSSVESAIEYFGDRFYLRPTPITQPTVDPTPEPTESTQVETSEVEAATTPEFDWSSVEDDIEAVCFSPEEGLYSQYKHIDGELYWARPSWEMYNKSKCTSLISLAYQPLGAGVLILRPPAPTTPEAAGFEEVKGSTDLRLQCREAILSKKPSIHTILQEAQQSILKHHGVTGKVKFIVTCS